MKALLLTASLIAWALPAHAARVLPYRPVAACQPTECVQIVEAICTAINKDISGWRCAFEGHDITVTLQGLSLKADGLAVANTSTVDKLTMCANTRPILAHELLGWASMVDMLQGWRFNYDTSDGFTVASCPLGDPQ